MFNKLFSRAAAEEDAALKTGALVTGVHRTPGLALICEEYDKRPPKAILDLGTSSTENLRFFGQYCEQVTIQDVVHAAGGVAIGEREGKNTRIEPFHLPELSEIELPEDGALFDTILLWDVLHYAPAEQRAAFLGRLSNLCRPGGMIWLIASASAPVPLAPMRFRIEDSDHLFYQVQPGRGPAPRMHVRQLEKWLPDCEPVRLFQLRNGFQEMLFRRLVAAKAA